MIEWYKDGGIMTKPTMFGLNGSNAMIGGEAGPEAILPISNLRGYIRDEMKNFSIDYDMMTKSFIAAIKTTNLDNPQFNFDGNRVTDAILPYMPEKLKQNEILKNRRNGDI